jgi:hypothetical protein
MSKHTPAPWKFYDNSIIHPLDRFRDRILFDLPCRTETEQDKADIALICAAPELYEALVMVRDADNDCHKDGLQTIPPMARQKIDDAISKAEGSPE